MDTEIYSIVAMIGRYALIIFCFLVFVQAILEIKKAAQHENLESLASIKWQRKRILFPLESENTVGRSNSCDIVVKAATLKKRHFRIYLDCDEWIILPYKKAKLYINKLLVDEKAQLTDGDKISAGKENFVFAATQDYEEDDNV